MEDITVVSDLAWIPRGVAKLEPIKLQMDKAQLSELLQGDNAGTDEEQSAMEEEKVEKTDESADEPEKEGNMMKGVAMYADPKDDPYLTKHEDSEDEAEKDDF
uniref:Uncharacterized protein n=1 Tax=Panagrolaimus sp. JU765 TaxID=591449 RepID=A0AC34Q3R9_9BILA